jgi:hypothetical protein
MPLFTRLRASESLFFACSKKSNQKKEHPTLAPYAQSLCSGYARQLDGVPTRGVTESSIECFRLYRV